MALTGSPDFATRAAHPVRFLGREQELERFRRRVDTVAAGRGGLMLLTGEPGVGKSTLAAEVSRRVAGLGFTVLQGRFREGGPARPFGAFADALESLALQATASLAADAGDDAGVIVRVCPRLTPILPNFTPAVPLEPADERLRLHEAFTSWLRRVTARAPVLLVLDDLHAADADTVRALRHLAEQSRELPLLILGVANRGVMRRSAIDMIQLAGLDEGATSALVSQTADRPVGPDVIALIQEATAGNPLFSQQLYHHLAEEHRLPGQAGGRLPSREELPEGLGQVVAWRTARLTGDARNVLNVLGAIDAPASAQLVATVAGISRTRAVTALDATVEAGLATVDERVGEFATVHRAIALALLSALPAATKAQLHRRLAEAIESDSADRLRENASEIAFHYGESSQLDGADRGLRYCLLAAEQARAAFAYVLATDFLDRALRLAPVRDARARADVLGRLAVSEAAAGQARDALKTAHRLLDSIPPHQAAQTDVMAAVVQTLRLLRGTGVAEPQRLAFEELRVASLARVGRADAMNRSRLELMAEHWREAEVAGVALALWSDAETSAASAVVGAGDETDRAELMLPQRARAQADTAQAAAWSGAWRRPTGVLRSLRCVATDLITRQGLFREGTEWSERYLSTAVRFGSRRDRVAALLLLGRSRAALGNLAGATEVIAEAVEILRPDEEHAAFDDDIRLSSYAVAHFADADWPDSPASARPAALALHAQRALAHARAGNEAEAREMLTPLLEAVALLPPLTYLRDVAMVTALTAAWELGAAEHAAAGQVLVRLAAEGGSGGQIDGSLGLIRARLLALAGDVSAARAAFAGERGFLEASGQRPLRAIADHDEAVAIAAAGPAAYNEATKLLHAAANQFRALGMTGWHDRAARLITNGLESAAVPGGRLQFTYPRGLSRREADVVRLMAGGASADEAATALVLERQAVDRLLASALAKLGGERRDELPRLARRYGLGGT